MKIMSNDRFADIPSIRVASGNITTNPKHINKAFQDFYSILYKSEVQPNKIECEYFLRQLDLPKLTAGDALSLEIGRAHV